MTVFSGRVGLIQRVLAEYRVPFFNALGESCPSGLGVFAGNPRQSEMIKTANTLDKGQFTLGKNLNLFQGSLYLCIQIGLMRWLKEFDPEVLIVEANPRYLRTSSALWWMRHRGRAVIGWGLGAPDLSGPLAGLRRQRRARFISQFTSMITYSQVGAEEYIRLGFLPERIFIARNAVTPAPDHAMPIRPLLASGQRGRVLFVGRLQARKQVDSLLRACSQLAEPLKPEVVIVGDGPDRPRLQKLAAEIYPHTSFTGALYGADLEAEFRAADLFVLPGTGGLAIQQAMSYGLPVIAAEADGTQADLVRPENGWQIPPNNLPALQAALAKALADITNLRKMGAESYRIVSEEINLEKMVATFVEALNRSLE